MVFTANFFPWPVCLTALGFAVLMGKTQPDVSGWGVWGRGGVGCVGEGGVGGVGEGGGGCGGLQNNTCIDGVLP